MTGRAPYAAGIAVLAAGLAAIDAGLLAAPFGAVALALAAAAEPLLHLAGLPLLRAGAELRALDGSWAVVVTTVCDGSGLVAAWAALCTIFARSPGHGVIIFVAGTVVLQVLNLVRVVALALTLANRPEAFDTVHLDIFPMLTVAVLAALAVPAFGFPGRRVWLAILLGAGLALAWHPVAESVVAASLVPAANALIAALGPEIVGPIGLRPAGMSVGTALVAATEPLRLRLVAIWPADFAVALPALLAVAALAPRRAWLLLPAVAAMAAALALGAVTEVLGLAARTEPALRLAPSGGGIVAVTPIPATELSLLRLAQNLIVHLNLLVLPLIVLEGARKGG